MKSMGCQNLPQKYIHRVTASKFSVTHPHSEITSDQWESAWVDAMTLLTKASPLDAKPATSRPSCMGCSTLRVHLNN